MHVALAETVKARAYLFILPVPLGLIILRNDKLIYDLGCSVDILTQKR